MANRPKKLKVITLGGVNEIGKNITAIEYGNDIILVDCGVAFPDGAMLGIDLVIPDFSYLKKNAKKIRGLFITHGHEDHIGSIPYLLKELSVPLYGTNLSLALVANKLKEHNLKAETKIVTEKDKIVAGCFKVEFIPVNHSIADASALAIETPIGLVIHSGDFKIDYTPIQGEVMDLQRFAEYGKRGVKLFLCESTNVLSEGYTMSEKKVGKIFSQIFEDSAKQRIIVATFSSNIHRIQQIVEFASTHKRKVVIMGRSMVNNVKTARELGYIKAKDNLFIDINAMKNYKDEDIVIITTGSQGEPMAALSRMSKSDHKQVVIKPTDKIVISASPIPGNEKLISNVINELMRRGAEVIFDGKMDVHVSGHAKREELKILHSLIKPEYFIPVHGEYRHLKEHRDLAIDLGMDKKNIFVMGIGDVLELTKNGARQGNTVEAGRVLVDGLGIGDVGNIVLRDRKHLSEDGLIIVVVAISKSANQFMAGPDIISRGFVYVRESEELLASAKEVVVEALKEFETAKKMDWNQIKVVIRDSLKSYIWKKTKRGPMILPIIMEVD